MLVDIIHFLWNGKKTDRSPDSHVPAKRNKIKIVGGRQSLKKPYLIVEVYHNEGSLTIGHL